MATEIFINTDLRDLTANAVASKSNPTKVVQLPQIVEGETLDVELSLVDSSGGYDSRSGDSSVSLAVAVSARGAVAESGTFTLAASTETTAPLSWNAPAESVQTALNALNSGSGAYGSKVKVSKLNTGSYRVIFDDAGARTNFGGTSVDLAPESEVTVATAVVGSATIRAQMVIEVSQQPAIYTSSWTTGSNKFSGQLNANTARVQELIATSQDAFFEVKADDDVICQIPITVFPAVAAPNSLSAHTIPSNLNDFANDPSTNGSFSATNWLVDLLAPHTKAVWGYITGTLSDQTDLQAALDAKQNTLTFGTANTNAVKIDNTSAAANGGDIAIFASTGIMPKTFQTLKSDLGVDDKAPKASPTFTGTATFSGDASFEGSSFTIDASTDASFDGPITVTGDAEFEESILLEGGAEIGGDVAITNGGIELQDGGIEITSDGEIELQGSGGVVLQGSGDVQLQGGGNVTVTDAGKIKVGSDLEITKDTIDFDGVEVIAIEERFLQDENGNEAFSFNDKTKLIFGDDADTTIKVGIRKTTPSQALDVGGTIKAEFLNVTGGFESDDDCRITGELQVEGSGGLKVDDTIEADGDVTITSAGKKLTKQKCYSNGAVRLQRGNTASEEILLRYEGPNSEDFVIQQWHGGNKEGQIKFQGDTPNGSNTVRLDAKNVDVGFTGTVLTKIYSDTNVGANKKFVFTDTRDATDGLQFYHTGVRSGSGEAGRDAIQMGMYGSYGDSNIGEFKITHKIGTASNTDVLSISPTANKVKIHKPLNLGNVPVFANNTAATSLATGDVYRTSTGVLMIKY